MAAFDDALRLLGLSTPFLYGATTFGFFHWLDTHASDEAKKAILSILSSSKYDTPKVATAFVEVFDRVYGRPLLSLRSFGRSVCFTIFVSLIGLYEIGFLGAVKTFGWQVISLLAALIGMSLSANILMDYISLFVIRRSIVRSTTSPLGSLLGAGAIGVCLAVAAMIVRLFYSAVLTGDSMTKQVFVLNGTVSATFDRGFILFTMSFPNLIVFIWLPLLAVGIICIRAANMLSPVISKTQWFLKDGAQHPLDAIGIVSGVIVFMVAAAGRLFF